MPLRTNTVDFDELTSDPSSVSDGQIWYNSTTGELKGRFGGSTYVISPAGSSSPWTKTATAIHPVTLTDDVIVGATAAVGTERLRVVGDTRLEGKLTVTGLIDPTGLLLDGQASAPTTPSANEGLLWVDDSVSPSRLVFTNDGAADSIVTTSLITLTAGAGLTGGGDMSADRTFDVVANADGSIQVNANDIQVGVLASDAQHGNRGGGALHANATTSVAGFMSATDKTTFDNLGTTYAPQTRTLTAGAGLTGGGDLSADRTFNVVANVDGSIAVNADDIQVGVLASDSQHGNLGGGSLHAVATGSVAGFMSAADKTTFDALSTTYAPQTRNLTAGAGLTGGGDLSADRTFNVIANADGSIAVNADDIQVGVLASDAQHGNLGNGTLHSVATTSVNGFLSAADKTTIDNLGTTYAPQTRTLTAGAGLTGGGDLTANRTFNVVANVDGSIAVNADDIQVGVLASDAQHGNLGGGALHAVATGSVAGFMSAADKTTFDALSTTYVPQSRTITAGAGLTGGGDLTANRTINVIANADGSIQVNADDVQVGVLATDAQHGTRGGGTQHSLTSASGAGFQPQSNRNATADPTVNDDSGSGYAVGSYWVNLTSDTPYICADASAGAAVWISAAPTPLSSASPADVTKAAASAGSSTDASRADHKHDISTATAGAIQIGDSAAEGTATSLARSDHTHSLAAPAAPANVTKAAAAAGTSTAPARADHKHDITTANVSSVGTANAEGTATSLARSDHVHNHGAQALGTGNQHAVATTSVAGFMSSTDKTKLDGIAADAAPSILFWGNEKIESNTTVRYLSPGSDMNLTAQTVEVRFTVPFACTMKNCYAYHNILGAGAQTVTYTIMKNGVATSLAASGSPGSASVSDTSNTVTFAAGDEVSVRVTKSASLDTDPEDVMVSVEVAK